MIGLANVKHQISNILIGNGFSAMAIMAVSLRRGDESPRYYTAPDESG
jgi:hypothetical protein